MNFKTFSVTTTTLFPVSNSTLGGQQVTEWNLRSRSFVPSNSNVDYDYALSYAHSMDDFFVRSQQDETGVVLSNSTLEVLPGSAIVNGHYVKQEASMVVDLLAANNELKLAGKEPLSGKLAVGIRAYYSTTAGMVGALEPEDGTDMYVGIQLVVLPASQLKTPEDTPKDESQVTCHLKLATFTFLDNEIRGVVQNPDKCKYVDADRIQNIDDLLSDEYVSRAGINPKKLYVLAGKQVNSTINNTWCDATDSLFVWDRNPVRTSEKPVVSSAQFATKDTGETTLILPHKNVDGMKVTLDEKNPDYGKDEYYKSVELDLPVADYATNTSGTISAEYTKSIKSISSKVDEFFHLIKGRQVAYIDLLESLDQLPDINSNWDPGDYVLVNIDNYAMQSDTETSYTRAPSTVYAVLPGTVQAVKFYGTSAVNSTEVPEGLVGVQLGATVERSEEPITSKTVMSDQLKLEGTLGDSDIVPSSVKYTTPEGIVYEDNGRGELVYSEENNDSEGNPQVLEADVQAFESEPTQLFTITKQTVNDKTGYSIECGGTYLTVTKEKPYKLYFNSELTEYGLFIFVDTDNKSQLSSADVETILTEGRSKRKIRPIEILSTALILQQQVDGTNLLTGVQELISKVNELTDPDSETAIPYIETLVKNVTDALETADADTAISLANELKEVVDRVFDSDTDKNNAVRTEVEEAKKAVDAAAADDTSSVQDRVEAVNKAYDALDKFMETLNENMNQLQELVDTVKDQVDATKVGGTDYSIYGRVTAYSKDDVSYVYVSENRDMQEQMWQILESGSEVTIVNSCYGTYLTQQDAKKLKETKYIINYQEGSISGLPMIGSASYDYYSTNILADLLNYFTVTSETYGVANEDYFVYRYRMDDSNFQDYYYVVTEEGTRTWSNPVWLTGTFSLATEEMVGGFINVPENAYDGGYVRLNDQGYLQLMDYDILRSGAAAYQLGEDLELSAGITAEEVQTYLDEYVNDRVMFPNTAQMAKAEAEKASGTTEGTSIYPEVINLTVNISAEESESTIVIKNLDSRFNGSLYLHITGTANSNNTIVLQNIEKLRIDESIEYDESDPPTIVLDNCCLYYSSNILNRIATCNASKLGTTGIANLKLWYQAYEESDALLTVDGMTVSETNAPKITDVIDFWNEESPNDNHFHVALHSITLAADGTVWKAGLLVANDSTSNIQDGKFVAASTFELPQGNGLNYPEKLVNRQIKITGTFESGYQTDTYYVVQDTKFTALTQAYDPYNNSTSIAGSILFLVDVSMLDVDFNGVSTEAWEPDTFHLFTGAVV